MTFRIYIFFFICLGLSWMPAQGENYENEITICSFNIRGSNMDTGVNEKENIYSESHIVFLIGL